MSSAPGRKLFDQNLTRTPAPNTISRVRRSGIHSPPAPEQEVAFAAAVPLLQT
jgi:hypothetical protein